MGDLKVHTLPNTAWVTDGTVSAALESRLLDLLDTNFSARDRGPVKMGDNNVPSFENEKSYEEMDAADDGLRLLSLFRYWNIIYYFYPYHPIPNVDWDATLRAFIPMVIEGDVLCYQQTMARLVSQIQDTRATIFDAGHVLRDWAGGNLLPVKFLILDAQVVLTEIAPEHAGKMSFRAHDIVRAIDGADIWSVIERKLTYISTSNKDRIVNALRYDLFRTAGQSMRLTIERQGKMLEITAPCVADWYPKEQKTQPLEMLAADIALINPAALK